MTSAERLREVLLKIGGSEVHIPDDDPDLENVLARGQAWRGAVASPAPGLPDRCHQNAIWLWEDNRDDMRIATGYALSDDGGWRSHSWCVDVGGTRVFETTEPRADYYGFIMTEEECEDFLVI